MSRPPFGMVERFQRRLHGIPPRAALDPQEFAERDYPVFCLDCGYLLRGLADGRCPECGREFQRGELIVDIYVRLLRPQRDSRRRLAWATWLVGFVPLFVASLGLTVVWAAHAGSLERTVETLTSVFSKYWGLVYGVITFVSLFLQWASILLTRRERPPGWKRNATRNALKATLAKRE